MLSSLVLIEYLTKKCVVCGSDFKPNTGHVSTCSSQCAKKLHNVSANNWKKTHKEHLEKYGKLNKNRHNELRRDRRKLIQSLWGQVGGLRGTWKNKHWQEAEKYAVGVIASIGIFQNVKRLDYFPYCPFDIKAEKKASFPSCTVFAVTCRTHIDDLKRHICLADDLLLDFYIVYVKPDLTRFVLKHAKDKGSQELKLRDILEVSKLK